MDVKKEVTIPLWLHDHGHLSGNFGPFVVEVHPEESSVRLIIGGAVAQLEQKTSKSGVSYFKAGGKGFDFTLFKNESSNPRAPKYRLLISEWKPKETVPAPGPAFAAKVSFEDSTSTGVQPVKPFHETSFTEEDLPF